MIAEEEEEDYKEPRYEEDSDGNMEDVKKQDILLKALGMEKSQHYQSMQFEEICNNRAVKILIDGGSTLNLVSRIICSEVKLKVEQASSYQSI